MERKICPFMSNHQAKQECDEKCMFYNYNSDIKCNFVSAMIDLEVLTKMYNDVEYNGKEVIIEK